MTPNRDALRDALRSSLSDVLVDLGTDNRGVRPLATPTGLSVGQSELAAARAAGFDAPFLPSRQQSLFSQSFGLPSSSLGSMSAMDPLQRAALAASMGISADGILLAAAAASERSKLLEQAKASLLQQQLLEENKRLMLQKSYLSLLQNRAAAPKVDAVYPQLQMMRQVQSAPNSASKIPGGKALEALGSCLRSKTDPYIDVSDMADPDTQDNNLTRTRGGVSEPFPEKLHCMLEDVENTELAEVVSFFSHGRAFGVHDMDRFVKDVMPKYFKQTKWNSFARQLNLYGFIRITSGPDAGGYYHELFLKGRPKLCLHMRRVGVPQGEDRRKFRPKNKNVEPDFYSMKRISM